MPADIHQPFWDGKFKGMIASMKNSPYPLWYTLLWPLYFRFPSKRKRTKHTKSPLHRVFNTARPDDISILLAGDIMVLNGDRVPRLSTELIELMSGVDLFVANCEAPVGNHKRDHQKKYSFIFKMSCDFFKGIFEQTSLAYDQIVLTNSNNHSGDAGAKGHYKSFEILTKLGVTVLGLNAENAISTKQVGGIKLGFSGWTHWLNCKVFGQSPGPLSYDDIRGFDIKKIKKSMNIDYMIGLPHWEYEFQHYPRKATIAQGRSLIRSGFDLLLGSHPHVLQPLEMIGEKLCFYSLGNFCGLGIAWPVKIIPLVEVCLGVNDDQGATVVKSYKYHFFYQYHTDSEIVLKPLLDIDARMFRRAKGRISETISWEQMIDVES